MTRVTSKLVLLKDAIEAVLQDEAELIALAVKYQADDYDNEGPIVYDLEAELASTRALLDEVHRAVSSAVAPTGRRGRPSQKGEPELSELDQTILQHATSWYQEKGAPAANGRHDAPSPFVRYVHEQTHEADNTIIQRITRMERNVHLRRLWDRARHARGSSAAERFEPFIDRLRNDAIADIGTEDESKST